MYTLRNFLYNKGLCLQKTDQQRHSQTNTNVYSGLESNLLTERSTHLPTEIEQN